MLETFKRNALLFVFLLVFPAMNFYSQQEISQSDNVKNRISKTGIIESIPIEEKVAEEDVLRITGLNEESAIEYSDVSADGVSSAGSGGEDEFDIDSLFDESLTTEAPLVTNTTEVVKVDPKGKPITFSGSLTADFGGALFISPFKNSKPYATFSNTLRFTGRPTTDFYVTGAFNTTFPQITTEKFLGIYELYFNYTLFGAADLSAGKRDISWSLSRLLDTNIIDDESNRQVDVMDVLKPRPRTSDDSRFLLALKIPLFSYGSIQGLAYYYPYTEITDVSKDNLGLAGKIEGSFWKLSLSVFGMRWPTHDPYRMNPVIGAELVSSLLGTNSNMFAQGIFYINKYAPKKFDRARLSVGVYKYWSNPIMLGFALEAQALWAEDATTFGTGKKYQHYFAAEIWWSRFILSKKWTFGAKWFHDGGQKNGTVSPGIKIEGLIKHTDLNFTIPISYGKNESDRSYALVLYLTLNLNY